MSVRKSCTSLDMKFVPRSLNTCRYSVISNVMLQAGNYGFGISRTNGIRIRPMREGIIHSKHVRISLSRFLERSNNVDADTIHGRDRLWMDVVGLMIRNTTFA